MERFIELDEITLLPTKKNVGRKDINFLDGDMLPVFTSPTAEICGEFSVEYWMENRIQSIIPRSEPLEFRLKMCPWVFAAFTPAELSAEFLGKDRRGLGRCLRIYIDTVNGLEDSLFQLAFSLKSAYQDGVVLMTGPCANQEAYNLYSQAGIQYMVLGAGIGKKYGFDYPIAQLLIDITKFKASGAIGFKPVKIVAEGDFSNPVDIVKAMALGADAVIVKRAFLRVVEAEGTIYVKTQTPDGKFTYDEVSDQDAISRISQEELKRANLYRLFEGKWYPVTMKMSDWVARFKDAASYAFTMTGAKDWTEFKKEIRYGRVRVD